MHLNIADNHPAPLEAHPFRPGQARHGFTLFEVAISLVIVSFGVISVLMLFPVGIRAQQTARFQVYAATKAEEMVESFNSTTNANPAIDTEGCMPWDTSGGYRAMAWDLEARLSSHRYGIMPLPSALAQRLDSDNDEIQQVLGQGGYIYYSQALATTETEESGNAKAPPNDAQKLIFTINGYAQQNALHMFAMKDWPYSTPMPSPPLAPTHMPDLWLPFNGSQGGNAYWSYARWPGGNQVNFENYCYPWESIPANLDPDMHVVYDWPLVPGQQHIGYFPYACGTINGQATLFPDGTTGIVPTQQTCLGYVQAAVWYFQKKVGPLYGDVYTPGTVASLDPHHAFLTTVETDRWKEVQAFRFLAHATSCLTSWFSLTDVNPQHMDLGTRGVVIPPATINGYTSVGPGGNPITIWDIDVRYYHERAMYLLMQFSAMYPYDWAVPRSTNRTIMTDYPLIMSDMWSPPLIGQVFGMASSTPAAQWRPVSGEPIQHIGVSMTYPVLNATSSQTPNFYDIPSGITALDASMQQGSSGSAQVNGPLFGNIDHYTLAAPFAAAERCREIVFWSADWQSYEDFETLPSAPVDASKYPNSAPRSQNPYDSQFPKPFGSDPIWAVQRNFQERMGDIAFRDEQLWAFRNPEKCMLFLSSVAGKPTGSSTSSIEMLNTPNLWSYPYPDQGSDVQHTSVFNGLYGADRNFNQVLDRGPVPRSVRLRAQLIARFNYYDPRVPAVMR